MTPARKIIFGLILSAACAALSAATLATVNGEDIDSRIIEYNAKSLAENEGMADTPELRRELLRLHVVATVVSQQARQLKLDESAEFRQMRQKLLDKLAAQMDEKNPEFGIERLIIEKNLLNDAYARYVAQKNPAREKDARALSTTTCANPPRANSKCNWRASPRAAAKRRNRPLPNWTQAGALPTWPKNICPPKPIKLSPC